MKELQHVFYINLAKRTDRRHHVEQQLKKVGIRAENITRFNAIQTQNGAIGCSMSHLKCLEMAIEKKYPHILIVEDDIAFLNPELFINQFNTFFSLFHQNNQDNQDNQTNQDNQNHWDVLLLAGNNIAPYTPIHSCCVQVQKCQTTTGYLVNQHYFKTLHDNIKQGLQLLLQHPEMHYYYAVDKYWFSLQQRDKWLLLVPLTVIQREDYSNIEKKKTNYKNVMLCLDKPFHLFK